MKSSVSYAVMSSICALIVGLLLILWPDVAVNYLVITIGVLVFCCRAFMDCFPILRRPRNGSGPTCMCHFR